MKMYDYLVSYTFNGEGYLTPCGGNSRISRKKKIKTFEDLEEAQKVITESIKGASNLCINNLVLLGRNKH